MARIQRDGRLAAVRVEREIRKLARRARIDVTADSAALRRELASRLKQAEGELERRVTALEKGVRARLGIADAADVTKLVQRVAVLDRRLGDVEARMNEFTDRLHDLLPAERG